MADIGDRGELLLSSWCSEVDIVANRSNKDLTGWDHILEFQEITNLDNDVHFSSPQCKIQVKATNGSSKKVAITLLNLRRMVTDPLPTFILYIEYNNRIQPQRVFLKHVDKDLIARVLKKIHIINESDNENKFNKKTMSISFNDNNELKQLSGECLKSELSKYFGSNFEKYVEDKCNYLKSVGYEEGYGSLTVTTKGMGNTNKLIDLSLGVQGSVELEELTSFKQRFGIKSSTPLMPLVNVYDVNKPSMSMPDLKATFKGDISLTNLSNPSSNKYNFEVEVFISSLMTDISSKNYRYRIKLHFGDIIIWPNQNKMNCNFSLDNITIDIWEMHEAVKFLVDISKGVRFQLKVKDSKAQFSLGNVFLKDKYSVPRDYRVVEDAVLILKYFDIREPIQVTLEGLLSSQENILLFSQRVRDKGFMFCFTFVKDELNFNPKLVTSITNAMRILIGTCSLTAIYRSDGNIEELAGKYIMQSIMNIEEKIVRNIDDDLEPQEIELIIEKVIERRKKEMQ